MDTYNQQKLPTSHAVANTPPNQAARLTGLGPAKGPPMDWRAKRAKPAANKVRLSTCNQPSACPLPGHAMEAA
jgi:hypothetical protein